MTNLESLSSSLVSFVTKFFLSSVILTLKGSEGLVDSGFFKNASWIPNSAPIGISVIEAESLKVMRMLFRP